MREIISNLIACILGSLVVVLFLLAIMTPEKDKYGKYTSFRRYWSDDKYLCENFNGVDKNFCEKLTKGE